MKYFVTITLRDSNGKAIEEESSLLTPLDAMQLLDLLEDGPSHLTELAQVPTLAEVNNKQ